MLIEEWRPVVGHETEYEISNFGQVRSVTRSKIQISRWGGIYERIMLGRLLKPGKMTKGHLSVAIGKGNSRTIHSMVLEAFVGLCPDGEECRHLDGNEAHNWLQNLAWGTRSENLLDRWQHARARAAHN